MSVGKIALGVFLGNLAFAILAWLVFAIVAEQFKTTALYDRIDAQAAVLNQH